MAYTVDKKFFEDLATEIAELYNICKNTEIYKTSHVEISLILIDYDDGYGYRIISRALIRNPVKNEYDMVVDVQDSPEEALKKMLKDLKEQAEKNFDLKYKIKISKYN